MILLVALLCHALHQLCFMQHQFVDRSHCSGKRSLIDSWWISSLPRATRLLVCKTFWFLMSKSQDKLVDTGREGKQEIQETVDLDGLHERKGGVY
jgi:hypothetical protein